MTNKQSLYLKLLFFLVIFSQDSFSQTSVSGNVVDDNSQALSYANVLVLSPIDSSLIKGDLTDDNGNFHIKEIEQGSYLISISYLGYNTYFSESLTVTDNQEIALGNIILSEGVSLEEVQVTAKKALFEQKIDRLVVNVASSLTAAGGTALEVLEKSPGVIVNRQSNSISMVGKDGLSVMINGKLSYQPIESIIQMLAGMPSDNIETIELITTPPANLDAEGNAGFINIILKSRTDLGLNGNWSASLGYGKGETASASVNLNYRKDKFNIFTNYSYTLQSQDQKFTNYRKVFFENTTTENDITTNREPAENNHNLRLGMDYELSDNTVVGLLFGAYNNRWTMDAKTLVKQRSTMF